MWSKPESDKLRLEVQPKSSAREFQLQRADALNYNQVINVSNISGFGSYKDLQQQLHKYGETCFERYFIYSTFIRLDRMDNMCLCG